MTKCPNCGASIPSDIKSCDSCKTLFDQDKTSQPLPKDAEQALLLSSDAQHLTKPATEPSDGVSRVFITLFFVLLWLLFLYIAQEEVRSASSVGNTILWSCVGVISIVFSILVVAYYHLILVLLVMALGLFGVVRGCQQLTVSSAIGLLTGCALFALPFLVNRFVFAKRKSPLLVEGVGIGLLVVAEAIVWQFEKEGLLAIGGVILIWLGSLCFRGGFGILKSGKSVAHTPNPPFEKGRRKGAAPLN